VNRLCAAALLCVCAGGARADPAAALRETYRDWMIPQAAALVADSERLEQALRAYCAAPAAPLEEPREAWRRALAGWERLSAVSIGPLLENRTRRMVDFTPARARQIAKAIQAAPASAAEMELVGAPAKGFPALEWLLWTQPIGARTPACAYAVQVAEEIGREAVRAEKGFRETFARGWDAKHADDALGELVNQWVGGLERLRWPGMDMPLNAAAMLGKDAAPVFPRAASGAAATGWAAQWQALRALGGRIASLLREQGRGAVAESLERALRRADERMAGLTAADPVKVKLAVGELSALKRVMELEVAPALGVHIGFSDADGD
jgi:predicted lipoprotein